jgi:hypothetical protein
MFHPWVRPFVAVALVAGVAGPVSVSAQNLTLEAGVGGARFTESQGFDHAAFTVGGRWRLTPRLRVGPELVYLRGPDEDRDLIVTGNATFDLRSSPLTVYLLAGAGLFRHSERVGTGIFASTEGSFAAGAGVRIPLRAGWYLAPEFRTGWEPHIRAQVLFGRGL